MLIREDDFAGHNAPRVHLKRDLRDFKSDFEEPYVPKPKSEHVIMRRVSDVSLIFDHLTIHLDIIISYKM